MKQNGPFGLRMNMKREEFSGDLREIGNGKYLTSDVPTPHSAFRSYALQIAPRTGLSWIKAIGAETATNIYGHELQTAFDSMKTKLSAAYGQCESLDFLLQGSIWNEPRDWMKSLLSGERLLMAQWSSEKGSHLNNALSSIALVVTANDTSTGWIAIEYSFENNLEAKSEIAALEDGAL